MRERNQVHTAEARQTHKQNQPATYPTTGSPFVFFNKGLELLNASGFTHSLLQMRGRTEREPKQEKRGEGKQHSQDSHPEVSDEAFPEERNLLVCLNRIEVEEKRTEGELEEQPQVE